jgi:uncharacterized SAM-binding protein YcdF (DUF218 family)
VSWLSYSSLVPPNLFMLLAAAGLAIAWWKRWLGLALATAAVGCLYLVSTPVVAYLLIRSSEAVLSTIPTLPSAPAPAAIIVLAADARRSDTYGEQDIVGPLTLERITEAARQQRRLGFPILVSGGLSEDHKASLAVLMSQALEEDFGLSARWREERSRNTFENASFSAAILRHAGIASAFVVAHPWDMARTVWSFVAVGYPVVPMPVPGGRALPLSPSAFLPQVPALQDSYYALHELIGLAWYRLRYADWRSKKEPQL